MSRLLLLANHMVTTHRQDGFNSFDNTDPSQASEVDVIQGIRDRTPEDCHNQFLLGRHNRLGAGVSAGTRVHLVQDQLYCRVFSRFQDGN